MALILCDIDGTMVRGFSAYKYTIQEAIKRELGVGIPVDIDKYHGSTDRLIMQDILAKNRISYDKETIDRCLHTFGELFPEIAGNIRILPGVLETIPKLGKTNLLGLVTGNVEPMAREKLRLFQANGQSLDLYFPFGGFGSDPHKQRSDLVTLAVERARAYGWNGDLRQTYVIDDTPRGIDAANIARVRTIGITTGIYPEQELRDHGAEKIASSFTEIPELIR